jgi:hypothetical protein
MQDIMSDVLVILGTCLIIAAAASFIILFHTSARRRRRHKRHSRQPKIDLFKAEAAEPASKGDA